MTAFPYIEVAIVFAAFCAVAQVMRRTATQAQTPLPSRAHLLDGLPVPSPLTPDWVYTRLYYAAKDSLETGEPMAQVNVRTEDLVSALHAWRNKV